MNRRTFIKSEHFNLGEPLPLTYATTNHQNKPQQSQYPLKQQQQQKQTPLQPSPRQQSNRFGVQDTLFTNISVPKNRSQTPYIANNTNLSRNSSLVRRKSLSSRHSSSNGGTLNTINSGYIREKIEQLTHQINELETEQVNLVVLDAKLDEVIELVKQFNTTRTLEDVKNELEHEQEGIDIDKRIDRKDENVVEGEGLIEKPNKNIEEMTNDAKEIEEMLNELEQKRKNRKKILSIDIAITFVDIWIMAYLQLLTPSSQATKKTLFLEAVLKMK
ncbi:hypothetical protein PVL30_003246 [Lodderomyces elongisporus]|uniref:uncharacterized protein n=1 Tax=Lodderomyces elongisporus TaxID=36914 RepID=UPI0029247DEA|nr:uncharacterized protein PVL30_003246 [Lodderomyces elongisporus]WLF79491.1 hypothetical protein PVL30_003246 [Lodderomyces elongisporus]